MTDTQADESKAVAVLQDKGMVAQEHPGSEVRDLDFDRLLTGRPDAARFEEPGQFVLGQVIDKFVQQKKDFDSGDPLWNDDGSPKLEPVVILNTQDGLVTLYMSSWRMAKEVGQAVRSSGNRRMERGGTLMVRFVGFGEAYKKGAQPPKEYEAAYDPPGVTAGGATSWEESAPELGPPPRYASEVSAECLQGGDNCKLCDSRKCSHECHRASKPPEQLTATDGPPPF